MTRRSPAPSWRPCSATCRACASRPCRPRSSPRPRLSAALGGPEIWIKRDDLTGLCFGGNKTRQLEFVFADLLQQGCDTVVAGAYTQSNWCRQMTAASRKLGLDISLVLLHGEKGPVLQGNFLLYKLMGADVTVVDLPSLELLQPELEAKAEELRRGRQEALPRAPMGTENLALGAIGYVQAAAELDAQWQAAGIDPDWLVVCGANMTPSGLALGLKALGRRTRLLNVSPIKWTEDRRGRHRPHRQRHRPAPRPRRPSRCRARSRITTSISASATVW